MFDDLTIKKIQYYVYILKDPTNNEIFYIGKGVDNRVFQHAIAAINSDEVGNKLDRIRKIIADGREVEYSIVRHGISEETAHEIEATLIDIFQGEKNLKSDITNKVGGFHSHKRGIMGINEIQQFYGGKEIKIEDPVMLININKLYKRNITEVELYEAIRKSWKIGKNRDKVKYVLGNYKGIVREVYEVRDWFPIVDNNGRTRRGFNGVIANENIREKYINGLLKEYNKKGAAFPIRYVNC